MKKQGGIRWGVFLPGIIIVSATMILGIIDSKALSETVGTFF